ncbi:hypothetical protein [Paraburkholderia tropica]|uniref:hypothetical protein n=1 Tax=Paraburkholderia tropica TaxID=92647 RepID=UPI001CC6944D|nr:hypothetical protein [Paraburkholderia tropica]
MTTNRSVSTEPLFSSKYGDFLGDMAIGEKFCVFYRRRRARPSFLMARHAAARGQGENNAANDVATDAVPTPLRSRAVAHGATAARHG